MPWDCARGDAQIVEVVVGTTTPIAPGDGSIDTNSVYVVGTGSIQSFGICPNNITMTIHFLPQGGNIKLVNSLALNILGKKDRTISNEAYGTYICHGDSNWFEFYYADAGTYLSAQDYNDLVSRLNDSISRLNELEMRVAMIEINKAIDKHAPNTKRR